MSENHSSTKARILVVEDEQMLRTLLSRSLEKAGYGVVIADDGMKALEILRHDQVDLILLDILMPNLNGFETCTEIRKSSDVPIVMLTALSRPEDVTHGLRLGADEYITKPFTFREVEARIHSLLRRVSWTKGLSAFSIVTLDGIVLNDETGEVTLHDKPVRLTPKEHKLLRYLMMRPDQPVRNETLLEEVWGYDASESFSIIQSVVRRLRLKIEDDPSNPRYIVSVWGGGYKFQAQQALAAA